MIFRNVVSSTNIEMLTNNYNDSWCVQAENLKRKKIIGEIMSIILENPFLLQL